MAELKFRKASASTAKIRVAVCGVPGGGKTYGSLLLARGLVGPSGKIGVIDTERGRAESYVGFGEIGDFEILDLSAPFSPQRYVEAIELAYAQRYDALIVDSLSHEWSSTGGVLDQVNNLRGRGSEFSIWRKPSESHTKLIETIVRAPCHILCTMRNKMAYEVSANEDGKMVPKKLALAPVQREGVEYEFDVVVEIDQDHKSILTKCNAAYSKYLSESLTSSPRLSVRLGEGLRSYVNTGKIELPPPPAPMTGPIGSEMIDRLTNAASHVGGDTFKVVLKQEVGKDSLQELTLNAEGEKVLNKLREIYAAQQS